MDNSKMTAPAQPVTAGPTPMENINNTLNMTEELCAAVFDLARRIAGPVPMPCSASEKEDEPLGVVYRVEKSAQRSRENMTQALAEIDRVNGVF